MKSSLFQIKVLKKLRGVNFINVFMRSFYPCSSQKCKKLFELTVFFALLGSAHIKAASKILLKLTPGFIQDESCDEPEHV